MMTTFERRLRSVLLMGLLVPLACSDPEPAQEFLWLETYEEVCDDGLPCGWERVRGDAGDATFVETTFHPGEHGLRLDGAVTVRGPGSDGRGVTFTLGSLEARFIARCDTGASLELVVGLEEVRGDGTPTGRADMTLPARTYPPTTWSATPAAVLITSESAFIDGGLGPPLLTGNLRVTTVILSKSGPGSCEVGELIIDDPRSATRIPSDGC